EFLVLLGSSGSGKTTLLRMIAGLERPTSGEISIGDQRVDGDVPPRARGIAMVFQSYALYPHRTVFQNIAFPLEAARVPRKQIDEKVRWAAELFSISRYLDRYPRQLSGGERQRVALCRALVRDPSLPPRTVVGFRPEHFLPKSVFGPADDTRPFRFAVRRVEYLGSDRYVYGSVVEPGAPPSDVTVIAKLPATITLSIPEGETHEFAVPRRALRYFDADTGLKRAP